MHLLFNPVFYRSYSRFTPIGRESFTDVTQRCLNALVELGSLNPYEYALLKRFMDEKKVWPSGRWLWIGGTEWIKNPLNYPGAYNCSSQVINSVDSIESMAELAMMGCGTGAILELEKIKSLPPVSKKINLEVLDNIGEYYNQGNFKEHTTTISSPENGSTTIAIGDSRKGWALAYGNLIRMFFGQFVGVSHMVIVDFGYIRPKGELLKGFGGVANPNALPHAFKRIGEIMNEAYGRQLSSVELCLVIDEMAKAIVAGNIRRSAGMRQGSRKDSTFCNAKDNLWQQSKSGQWKIDSKRDALRMANHTIVWHKKPCYQDVLDSVTKQYWYGEGAIQYAPEAIYRANIDLFYPNFCTLIAKKLFINFYEKGRADFFIKEVLKIEGMSDCEIDDRLQRYGLNPCITGDSWIQTIQGARRVSELAGKGKQTVITNGIPYHTSDKGFFYTGEKEVFMLETIEGNKIKLTSNHKLFRAQSKGRNGDLMSWVEVQDLEVGDKLKLNNHRGINRWKGYGNFKEGWLVGSFLITGYSIGDFQKNSKEALIFASDSHKRMCKIAQNYIKELEGEELFIEINDCHNFTEISSSKLSTLVKKYFIKHVKETEIRRINDTIERASYDFYLGFLVAVFDVYGEIHLFKKTKVRIILVNNNINLLLDIQRMLLRVGILSNVKTRKKEATKLVITKDNLEQFRNIIGFNNPVKKIKLDNGLQGMSRGNNKENFLVTVKSITKAGIEKVFDCTVPGVSSFDANGFVAHNCGEIIMHNNFCNLAEVHLNLLSPQDIEQQQQAFKAAGIIAAILLHHKFSDPRFQSSRELDPIVGVSFTGLFDFFVELFGAKWLEWWAEGRPKKFRRFNYQSGSHEDYSEYFRSKERSYLSTWKNAAVAAVKEYCQKHNLKIPNRVTTVQPAGTKSLLTGASPGWHPPKSAMFIRRIAFAKNDPVAKACIDYGYNVIPGQSDKDENEILLVDPYDSRCTEWLVEIPVKTAWADMYGCEDINISKFSALAQFDFYMQVQTYYTQHNTSATIELRKEEIEPLAKRIHQAIDQEQGYISVALLARFDNFQAFPRMPIEPIDFDTYQRMTEDIEKRRKTDDFLTALNRYDRGWREQEGHVGCGSDKCLTSAEGIGCITE